MTEIQIRNRIKHRVDALSGERLKVVDQLLRCIHEPQDNPATKELLQIPGFLKAYRRVQKAAATTRGRSWREIRNDV